MRAAALFLALLAGCLSPGGQQYELLDGTAPTIVSIVPPMGGDAGTPVVGPGQIIEVRFSEAMDLASLRPGIAIRNKERREQALTIQTEVADVKLTAADRDVAMTVRISSADPSGFATGGYQLFLRTLLIDQQGNGLGTEFLGGFFVQN